MEATLSESLSLAEVSEETARGEDGSVTLLLFLERGVWLSFEVTGDIGLVSDGLGSVFVSVLVSGDLASALELSFAAFAIGYENFH